jgi:hypothetical protein
MMRISLGDNKKKSEPGFLGLKDYRDYAAQHIGLHLQPVFIGI